MYNLLSELHALRELFSKSGLLLGNAQIKVLAERELAHCVSGCWLESTVSLWLVRSEPLSMHI